MKKSLPKKGNSPVEKTRAGDWLCWLNGDLAHMRPSFPSPASHSRAYSPSTGRWSWEDRKFKVVFSYKFKARLG